MSNSHENTEITSFARCMSYFVLFCSGEKSQNTSPLLSVHYAASLKSYLSQVRRSIKVKKCTKISKHAHEKLLISVTILEIVMGDHDVKYSPGKFPGSSMPPLNHVFFASSLALSLLTIKVYNLTLLKTHGTLPIIHTFTHNMISLCTHALALSEE